MNIIIDDTVFRFVKVPVTTYRICIEHTISSASTSTPGELARISHLIDIYDHRRRDRCSSMIRTWDPRLKDRHIYTAKSTTMLGTHTYTI